MKTVYDFSVKDRKGKDVSLKEYYNEAAHRQHSNEVWLYSPV